MNQTSESLIDPYEEDPTEVVRSFDLTVVSPVARTQSSFDEMADEITRDLVPETPALSRLLEPPGLSKFSPFFFLLLSPFDPEPFIYKFQRYLKVVRRRMIEHRDFDRIHFSHTLYQKCVRLAQRGIERGKANLRT